MAGGIPIFQVGGGINTDMVVDNKIRTVAMTYLEAIRHGLIEDHTYLHIRGHNHSIGTVDEEVSALGTLVWGNWPTVAAGVVLVSTDNTEDIAAGDGALTVIVRGLDEVGGDWVYAETTVTMTGTTPTAASAQTFIRIDEVEVVTAGSLLSNKGVITASIGGLDIMDIYAKHTTSDAGRRSVATGEQLSLENPEGSAVGNKEVTYHIFCRDNTIANDPFHLRATWHSKDGGYRPNGKLAIFTEKVDMIFIGHAATAGAACSVGVEGYTEPMPTP